MYVLPFIVDFCQMALCPNYESFLPNLDVSALREGPCLNIPSPVIQLAHGEVVSKYLLDDLKENT